MQTFLDQAAEYIFKQHSLNQLSRVCIVIPSRRGVLYFKDALAKLSDKPFLAPDVLAIDDFVNTMTGVRQIDQVALLFELYDVFKEIDPNVVFERFMTWASTLLNDFDKIDQYLVDAKALFAYMSEAKAIERWQMQLGESQRDRKLQTDRTDRYFKLFENIFSVYQNLRQRLADKGLHYRGMAYRELAENVEKYILSKERHTKYYFVGFNALSDAEEKIIRTLLKRKGFAETLWDSDAYYLYNKDQKAGNWLRYYKNGDEKNGITPLFNEEWKWQSDELLKGKKKIQIIGVANASVQAKVAGHIFKDWENTSKTDAIIPKSQTAIVLGDENLLVPVMNSLDESVKDFNVTMGLSLRNSMLFTLVDALFELQKNLVEFKTEDGGTVKIPKFSHRQIVRVLNHPFLRRYELIRFKPHPPVPSPSERGSNTAFEDSTLNEEQNLQKKSTANIEGKPSNPSEENTPSQKERGLGGEVSKLFTTDAQTWKYLKPFARENRIESTKAEELLWQLLRNRQFENYKFRRQHAVLGYIVDFINIEHSLIIELDGEIHEKDDNPKYDTYRTQELNQLGYKVLRFKNEEVLENVQGVLDEILRVIRGGEPKPHPPTPSPVERGSFSSFEDAALNKEEPHLQKKRATNIEYKPSNPSKENTPSQQEKGLGGEVKTEVENPIRKTLREITERNRVFLSSKELLEIAKNEPLFESIFKHWYNKPKNAVKCFYELIDLLREVYKENQDAIETEYLYQFYLILQRMEVILDERGDTVSIRSFKTFLYELIKQTKIPFESETDESLQIMGMLETRTLDFEKVIILSVNEKTLPQGKRQNTLIPFDALSDPQFNLPTHNHADAVMAYHFFRLMQRAKEVVLVHVLPSDTYGAGEKSRFILQIEHELSKLNPNLDITYPNVKFIGLEETEDKEETPLLIQKTTDILAFIEQEITEKGIFPSQMNQFLDCSLKYYFTRIAGIAQEEEVEEKIGVDTFGNWIHKTFENIDKTFVEKGSKVEKEDLQTVLENIDTYLKEAFLQTNQGLKADDGMNFILYQIGETIVKKFINYQLENEVFPIELLDVEKTLKVTFNAQVNDKVLPVKIAGRIDRLDRVSGNKIRVIDYKTGKVEAKELTMKPEDLEEKLLGDTDKDKFRQLWLYKYMVLKQMLSTRGLSIRGTKLPEIDNEVSAGIYSFRNIDAGLLEQKIAFNAGETATEFVADSEKYLQQFVSDLLNPEKPFEKTKDQDKCQYCDYKRICGR
ncbi:DUF559 domain-containing protein [Arcicella rigui]|uniref:DUF559 domain-containing protein n=1 Tax=Arcicella rigui TaxID=797020 RepID=A0ABU5QE50_9BACT|nr:DUF559 domain-containing protein [Arcicella rigui]MEA5140634.1 DUF559 domain-containing protein [Arcicella rigui]